MNCSACTRVRSDEGAGVMLMAIITDGNECRGINNRLLLSVNSVTLDRILRASAPVSLVRGQKIEAVGQSIKYIHFINRGLVCAAKSMEDGRMVEIAAIGVEGTTEYVALLGMDRALVIWSYVFQEQQFASGAMPSCTRW